MTATLTAHQATERQVAYIKNLMTGRVVKADAVARLTVALAEGITKTHASGVIDWFLKQPKVEVVAPVAVAFPTVVSPAKVEVGVYVLADGTIAKTKENKSKTAVYAYAWVDFGGTRLTLAGEKVTAHWEYTPGLAARITTENRMNAEQAKAFTELYGQCARCGRKLKAAESVERGIGPVCAKYFGL